MNAKRMMVVGVIILVLLADQIIKFYVKTHFFLGERLPMFDGCERAYFYFVENRGMAFGLDVMGGTLILTLFRILAVGVLAYFIHKVMSVNIPKMFLICLALVLAGAAGNIFDNVFYGQIFSESTPWLASSLVHFGDGYGPLFSGRVVDMFQFPLIDTYLPENWPLVGGSHFVFFSPIFNFADSCITCGGISILLFYRKALQKSFDTFKKSTSAQRPDDK